MNTRLLRSLAIAFAAGLVAAMPLVLLLVTDPPWLGHGPAGFIVVPAVVLLLGCGHWFFMQEPAIIGALLE